MASDRRPASSVPKVGLHPHVDLIRILGAVSAVVLVILGYKFLPLSIPALPSTADRLAFTLRWQVLPLVTLFAAVLNVALRRYNSRASDPLSGKDQHIVKLPIQFLQNTLEQMVLHVIGQLILTTYLDTEHMKVIPLLAIIFVIGRVTFWFGYQSDNLNHTNRAFGFAMNIFTNAAVLFYCGAALILDLIGIQIYW